MRAAALALLAACGPAAARDPCASDLTKGPWVQAVDATHATLKWESLSKACVEAAVAPEGGAEAIATGTSTETHVVSTWSGMGVVQNDAPGTYYRNEVALSGLAPGQCFGYRVRASGTAQTAAGDERGRFCTARPSGASFGFLAIGDTNPMLGHTGPVLDHALPAKPDFVLHLGDMQYYSSITETWAWWFAVMRPMLRAGALFPAVGNHENENNGLEYDDYYGRLFAPAGTDPSLTKWYSLEDGGVAFFSLDTEEPLASDSPQTQWLGKALADAKAAPGFRFSIAFMHRPLYTLGDAAPLLAERAVLAPLFEANGVKLVLAGHMHGYERFEAPDGITFVTCAGGGGIIKDPSANVDNYPADKPLRVTVSNHYSACNYVVAPGTIASQVVDEAGAIVDSFTKTVP